MPGAASHEHGRLPCFKAVGTYFGDAEACALALDRRLAAKLAPLDLLDTVVDTETISNTSQLKYKLLVNVIVPRLNYVCSVTPPNVSAQPLLNACARVRKSFELIAGANASPPALRDAAWAQAALPTVMGGLGLGTTPADAAWSASVLKCRPLLTTLIPTIAAAATTPAAATSAASYLTAAVAAYESVRTARASLAATYAAYDRDRYYTLRGGHLSRFRVAAPLPEPESLPPSSEIIDGTCKSTIPRTGSLVAVVNHQKWLSLHSELTACDASTDAAPDRPGQSATLKAYMLCSRACNVLCACYMLTPPCTTFCRSAAVNRGVNTTF